MSETARLLSEARAGRHEAFERLVEEQASRLYTIAYRITHDAQLAEDVVQDAFLRVLDGRAALRKAEAADSWLARVVSSLAIDQLRLRASRRRREELHDMRKDQVNRAPHEDLLNAEQAEQVSAALASLPPETRAAVWLNAVEGVPVREVALSLGENRGKTHRRIQDGMEKLRRTLGARCLVVPLALTPAAALKALPGLSAPPGLIAHLHALGPSMGTLAVSAAGAASFKTAPWIIGGLAMTGKKLLISAIVSLLLLIGGAAVFWASQDGKRLPGSGSTTPTLATIAREAKLGNAPVSSNPLAGGIPGKQTEPIVTQPRSIVGRVTDSSGKGVSGASVLALNVEPLEAAATNTSAAIERSRIHLPRTSTAADGTYALSDLGEGIHRVVVNADGFLSNDESFVTVTLAGPVRCDVKLREALSITGTVVDTSGAPVPYAQIIFKASALRAVIGSARDMAAVLQLSDVELDSGPKLASEHFIQLDEQGTFRLSPLEPVTYDVKARKPGYVDSKPLELKPPLEHVKIVLEKGASLEGRVVDPRGRPIGEAQVSLRADCFTSERSAPKDESEAHADTGADGRFRFEGLSEVEQLLTVRAEGFAALSRRIAVTRNAERLGDITLVAGQAIEGSVTDSRGAPVADARVWVPAPLVEATTDPSGQFLLQGVPEGAFDLCAAKEGLSGTKLPRVEAGSRDVLIQLRSDVAVKGRVLDAGDRSPVGGAAVGWERSPRESRGTTDAQGLFEVPGALEEPGSEPVVLLVEDPDHSSERLVLSRAQVEAGDLLEVQMTPHRRIEGRVVDGEGKPVPGASLRALPVGFPGAALTLLESGWPSPVESLDDGSFSVRVPERVMESPLAQVEIEASHPAFVTAHSAPISMDDSRSLPRRVEMVLTEGALLEGQVLDGRGSPVADAAVKVSRALPPAPEIARFVDALPVRPGKTAFAWKDGKYVLRRLEPATYDIEVFTGGRLRKRLSGILVGPPATRQDIVLDEEGTISGRAVDTSRRPIPGADVFVFVDAAPGDSSTDPGSIERLRAIRARRGSGADAVARTDEAGRFEIRDVSAGSYQVVVRAKGHEPAGEAPVAPNDPERDYVLEPLGAIDGVVVTEVTREPVTRFRVSFTKRQESGDELNEEVIGWTERGANFKPLDVEDEAGRFVREGLRAGQYEVMVEAEGFSIFTIGVALSTGEERSLTVMLSQGQTVSGVVLDSENGKPIRGARIDFLKRKRGPSEPTVRAESGPDGVFRAVGLSEGSYYVIAFHSGHYYNQDTRKCIKLELPRDSAKTIEVKMQPAGSLRGAIRNLPTDRKSQYPFFLALLRDPVAESTAGSETGQGDGESPPEWWVWINDRGTGKFQTSSILPGKYRVELRLSTGDGGAHEKIADLGEVEIRKGEETTFHARVP